MRKRLTQIILLCLCFPSLLLAQVSPIYSVQAPDVANLGQYGKIPVGLFTGTPDISVPLYELKVGSRTFPLSLNYHLASVRPNQYPESLGIGWSLMAGGATISEDLMYDFVGNTKRRTIVHRFPVATTDSLVTEDILFTYDHHDRLTDVTHSLNGGTPMLLAHNEYDALGRLSCSEKGRSQSLTTTYSYTVRSWITSITGSLFTENLYYNDPRPRNTVNAQGRYDGSLSSMSWSSARRDDETSARGFASGHYDISYDALGRLTGAFNLADDTPDTSD